MKIITILGTRPEIIRLSRIMSKLDKLCNHILIHTGQNYDDKLSKIFFEDLKLRLPDYNLEAKGTFAKQLAIMFPKLEKIFLKEKPDKILILGDTNSGLSAIIAERMNIPVFHMEAGNRCGIKMPEEMNRPLIDRASTINLPYTYGSRENLLREGFNSKQIFVIGNPIYEVINYYEEEIVMSVILDKLKIESGEYVLATLHRSETVDNSDKLKSVIGGYNMIATETNKIIISTHPRTKEKLKNLDIKISNKIKFLAPFGFFDFIKLEKNAEVILTDSGTCQEEASILRTPGIITREVTERPETIECGASMISGLKEVDIFNSYLYMRDIDHNWDIPKQYLDLNVSNKVINHLLGGYHG